MAHHKSKTSPRDKSTQSASVRNQKWAWVAFALVLIATAIIRIRLLSAPLERDEGEFAFVGRLMLQGIPPFAEAYNMKLPGIYAAYALMMAIFGRNIIGVHLGLLAVNAGAIVMVFLLGRRLFSPAAGVAACASYAVLSTNPSVFGFAAHATHYIVLPALAGILVLLGALESGRIWRFFWSGLLLGVAFTMKQPGVFFILFGLFYLVWHSWRIAREPWTRILARTCIFSAAAVIPFVVICIYMYASCVFDRFWFWTFEYARAYSSAMPLRIICKYFGMQMSKVAGPALWIWLLAAVGAITIFLDRKSRSLVPFVFGLLFFSLLALCPGFFFREHYFVLILPVVSIFVGAAVGGQWLSHISPVVRFIPAVLCLIAFSMALNFDRTRTLVFDSSPNQFIRETYGGNPFIESLEISNYLRKHTSPKDRIAIFGSEPQILFYADRLPATGYIYMYSLLERQRYAPRMILDMEREVEKAQPEYVVFTKIQASWFDVANPNLSVVDWAEKFCRNNYEKVGLVDIVGNDADSAYFFWGDEAKKSRTISGVYVEVFKRKSADNEVVR